MSPVSMVGAGAGGPPAYQPQPVTTTDGAAVAAPNYSGVAIATSSELSSTITISAINAAVAGLLEGIDGELADNEMLRMIIALMILIALLQNVQSDRGSADTALSDLGGQDGSQVPFVGGSVFAASIQIEQTLSTTVAVTAFSGDGLLTDGQPQPSGEQIDVSA